MGSLGRNENYDPTTVTSLAGSLSFLNISTYCGGNNSTSRSSGKTSTRFQESRGPSSSAASILARLTCQEDRQDQNVADTTSLRTAAEGEDEEVDDDEGYKEGSSSAREGGKRSKKPSQQRSQVALEVIKLRKELKRLKHIVQNKKNKKEMRDRELAAVAACGAGVSATTSTAAASSSVPSTFQSHGTSGPISMAPVPTVPHKATRVQFTEPLVTQVSYRPYTDPEDIEKLYFVEEELNELEWDRQTVADDQFEVIMASSASAKDVRIAHQKRRLLALHPQNTEGIPHSLSDLSLY